MSQEVIRSLKGHLWYLTEELVVFVLCDTDAEEETKSKVVQRLLESDRPQNFVPGKPAFSDIEDIETISLPDLVGPNSWFIFTLLDIGIEWMELPPYRWFEGAQFQTFNEFVLDIMVFNNAAERSVKDVTEYAHISQDSNHRNNVLLVVKSHRDKIHDIKCPKNCFDDI